MLLVKKFLRKARLLCAQLISCWYHFFVNPIRKGMLKSCGSNVSFDRRCDMDWENVTVGSDVHIGSENRFMCSKAEIIIGDHVMFGPGVTMITGNHRVDIIGRYMTSITNEEKLPENDEPIILKGDNWIGANATILKGVTLGRGSVVAAGALVNKSVGDYEIVGGVPAKVISRRFTADQIREHEDLLRN